MWIFCGGMPRSGSTLQFQITAQLVEDAGLGKRLEWVKPADFGRLRKQHQNDPGWKVFKTHTCTEKMEKEFHRGNAKGVYCYRDLRDVVVSTMRKFDLAFEKLWDLGFLDDRFREYQKWTALPQVLISKYEEMVADLPGEVERIAAHLGVAIPAEKCAAIAAEHTIERQKSRIEEAKKSGELREGAVQGILFDPTTNLHTNHIHDGAVGGWKEILTREQIERLETKAADWLRAHGYELTIICQT